MRYIEEVKPQELSLQRRGGGFKKTKGGTMMRYPVKVIFYKVRNPRRALSIFLGVVKSTTCRWYVRGEDLVIELGEHYLSQLLSGRIVDGASKVWEEGLCEDFDIYPAFKFDISKLKKGGIK